ncbi:hypothetical protein NM208_g7480 [Fusarium decemcellulare]|uniref:Uncharacterized protein n=1 Tax=Fusarium decemcellulare TaxID=57161 RepID=A0ACC1S923_9HYPO|nr:hypothetical protein NM208_g7480 [Fusarium decemcellulare]
MAGTPTMASCEASIYFLDSEHDIYKAEKPYVCLVPLTHAPPEFDQTNIKMVPHDVVVKNVRGSETEFKLDVQGFQLVKHNPQFSDWYNGPSVVNEYYPYVVDVLKDQLKAGKVYIYDHSASLLSISHRILVRIMALSFNLTNSSCVWAITSKPIRQDFKDEAEDLLSKRFQIVKYLKVFHPPRSNPVLQQPIAFCDYRTSSHDGFPADLVYPHLANENMLFRHSPGQQWYFVDQQRIKEAWMFKIADSSEEPNVSKFCPHTSFVIPSRDNKDTPLRRSIEFRAYVFYD